MTTTAPEMGGNGGFNVKAFGPGPKVTGNGGIGAGSRHRQQRRLAAATASGFGGRGTGIAKGHARPLRRNQSHRTGRRRRALLAGQASNADRQLEPRKVHTNVQRQILHRRRRPGIALGRDGDGPAAVPCRRANAQPRNGPFQKTVAGGVYWLISHQKADGDLSADAQSQMYSHGLAAIALCEDYGMSRDKTVGVAAQKAINFIQAAQNTKTGGWRYHPGEEGDTSVVGWQLMALKSAQMAGLTVNPATLDGTKKWLQSVSAGGAGKRQRWAAGQFSYQPDGGPTPPMSAVGMLCSQYLHAGRADPVVTGGVQYLMANQPDAANRNIYYWYYATQVMHNMADKDWDTWNRKMRKILVDEPGPRRLCRREAGIRKSRIAMPGAPRGPDHDDRCRR